MASTHEAFVHGVYQVAMARAWLTEEERSTLGAIKLVYGAGQAGLRGVTYYQRWKADGATDARPFVEVCAFGQESWVQVAGTCLHELGHVLAGHGAGHGKGWRTACERLGLRAPKAAGMQYMLSAFDPDIRLAIAALPRPDEGEPVQSLGGLVPTGIAPTLRPCPAGYGTRGGRSRGKGSGSRLRLWVCECAPPVRVRCASDELRAQCLECNTGFHAG